MLTLIVRTLLGQFSFPAPSLCLSLSPGAHDEIDSLVQIVLYKGEKNTLPLPS